MKRPGIDEFDAGREPVVRQALVRHGYNPDLPPRGVGGPPSQVIDGISFKNGEPVRTKLRNYVCQLDGIEIDGHEISDLDPGCCVHCGYLS